jgi:8-oxo-dGTP pyrophosphatase MutT (NUDIX family)
MRTINREIVGGFIFSNDGYMIVGKSQPGGVYPGYATIPGGGVDEGETKLAAMKREILEEVGLDISGAKIEQIDISLFGESEKVLKDTGERVFVKMHFNNFEIIIPKPAADITITAGDDFADARWIPVSDLKTLKVIDATRDTLKKLGYL